MIASAVEGLKTRGDARAKAVLAVGTPQFRCWNSDFGIDYWRLFVALPTQVFYAITEEDRKLTENSIAEVIAPFFHSMTSDSLESIVIIPQVTEAKDGWREDARTLRSRRRRVEPGSRSKRKYRFQTTSRPVVSIQGENRPILGVDARQASSRSFARVCPSRKGVQSA